MSQHKVSYCTIITLFFVMSVGCLLAEVFKTTNASPYYTDQIEAAGLMQRSLDLIKKEKEQRGHLLDEETDLNRTGIIGDEISDITTTAGNLEAKRTSANPDFAALMVKLLSQAGIQKGDVIAIGASGSFPALILASLSAIHTMELHPLLIYSIGSSSYGANLADYTFIEMLQILHKYKTLPYKPIAVSLGGERDQGLGIFGLDKRPVFLKIAQRSASYLIDEPSLAKSIEKRLEIYLNEAGDKKISLFINIGGASANYGNTPASLRLSNGLIRLSGNDGGVKIKGEGMIFTFLGLNIPVIHLLNIKELAFAHGIPIDPFPFPTLGTGGVYSITSRPTWIMICTLAAGTLVLAVGRLLYWRKEDGCSAPL